MAKKKTNNVLDIAVELKGVSIGDSTAKIGFSILKDAITLEQAESVLCGKRLTGRIVVTANGDDPDQKALPGIGNINHEIKGIFDCKGYRSTPKLFASGAVFLMTGLDVSELGHMAKKAGRLIVSKVEESDSDDEGDCDAE